MERRAISKALRQTFVQDVCRNTRRGWWEENGLEGGKAQKEVGSDQGGPFRPQEVESFGGF